MLLPGEQHSEKGQHGPAKTQEQTLAVALTEAAEFGNGLFCSLEIQQKKMEINNGEYFRILKKNAEFNMLFRAGIAASSGKWSNVCF